MKFLSTKAFWLPAGITFAVTALFFAWELGFVSFLPAFPRPEPNHMELVFTAALIILLSVNVGLLQYRKKYGSCPVGAKRATGIAGAIGVVALLCPACLLLPFAIFGMALSLAFLSPFIPLLQIIAIILLVASLGMLWPREAR